MRTRLRRIVTVVVLVIVVPRIAAAQAGADVTKVDMSFNLGPVAVSVQMTRPLQSQAGVVWDTLHLEARDDTQTPAFHATIDAVGQAADTATLLGGFLPAAIIVQNDLAAGQTLDQAVADAQGKTGVTITSFNDTAIEYAVLLALIEVVVTIGLKTTSPSLSPQLSAILGKLQTSLGGVGGTDVQTMVSNVQAAFSGIGGSTIIP